MIKTTMPIIKAVTTCLVGLCLAFLMILPGCGGGVSGGGTGGITPASVIIKSAGGSVRTDQAGSASAISGLGNETVLLGDVAFEQAPATVSAADGLAFPVSIGPGVQLGIVPSLRKISPTQTQAVSSRYALRAAVGVLQYEAAAVLPIDFFFINGQRILVDRRTVVIGASTLAGLANQTVAVSGYLEPQRNDIIATRIEPIPAGIDLAGQNVISAQVRSVDTQSQIASLGFAQLRLGTIDPATPVRAGQMLNLRVRRNGAAFEPLDGQALGAVSATGELVLRDVVTSRPLPGNSQLPLTIGGYTVEVSTALASIVPTLRLGMVVEVLGSQAGSTQIIAQSIRIISIPINPLPGEVPAGEEPKSDTPRDEYRILNASIEQLSAVQRSFILRGIRVQLHEGQPPVNLMNGQIISVFGEFKIDAQGQYLWAEIR